uniref:protein IMPACT-like n=1 Tax=Styela clava TaxID=7725 RepID=UPI0019395A0A|nr:protein IMPACT-like [Styela clava]
MFHMDESNLERQKDEIEALAAIYTEEFKIVNGENHIYELEFRKHQGKSTLKIILQVTLPPLYPEESPPMYEIQAPWLKGTSRQELYNALESIYLENIGEDILFMWAEKVRDILEKENPDSEGNVSDISNCETDFKSHEEPLLPCPRISHGETITDRKSTFQAHLAVVSSMDDIKAVRQNLLSHRKIANATHNIVAYRIQNKIGTFNQDCDDDGEHAAGGRLLHLLQILDVKNIIIIVSRWYGGIHLGPDRFKHINNAARSILQSEGFLNKNAK